MSDLHYYCAFGLLFKSDFAIPELPPAPAGAPDVEIHLGETPVELGGEEALRYASWEAVPGRWLITIAGIGRYFVTNGNEIRVEPAPGCNLEDLTAFLTGSAFAALLQQRRILPLHAGAVGTDAGAVLVMAPSGVGKSTLVTSLMRRGFPMLADDVTGIVFDAARAPMALAGVASVRLWPDSAAAMEMNVSNGRPVRSNISKRCFSVPCFRPSSMPVRLVIGLGTHNGDRVTSQKVSGWDSLSLILDNVFRKRYLGPLGLLDLQFATASAIADVVPVHRMLRPAPRICHDEVADHVMALIAKSLPPAAALG